MIYTPETALTALKLRLDTSIVPPVSNDEVNAIIAQNLRYGVWAASTVFSNGARVGAFGRLYVCVGDGLSGMATPFHSVLQGGALINSLLSPARYIQDNAIYWQDCGPLPPDNYDLTAAARAVCALKKSRCAGYFKFSPGAGVQNNPDQIFDHWDKLEQSFVSLVIG